MAPNSRILITGGSSGIGRAIAEAFAEQGAFVGIADIHEERAAQVAASLPKAMALGIDVADEASVERAFARFKEVAGGVDVLVNSAGVSPPGGAHIRDVKLADWHRVLAVNVTGTLLCCREAARHMRSDSNCSIINIGSVAGVRAHAAGTLYAVSKASVHQMTRTIAADLAPEGIRVNAIAPGPINTALFNSHPEEFKARYRRLIPMRRFGSVEDVASAAIYLASPGAAYVTGSILTVDGGFTSAGLLPES